MPMHEVKARQEATAFRAGNKDSVTPLPVCACSDAARLVVDQELLITTVADVLNEVLDVSDRLEVGAVGEASTDAAEKPDIAITVGYSDQPIRQDVEGSDQAQRMAIDRVGRKGFVQ